MCIGADGTNSIIRCLTGLDKYRQKPDKIMALNIGLAEPNENFSWEIITYSGKPAISTFFFPYYLGFGWLAPAKKTINVGMGVFIEQSHDLKFRFRKFLNKLNLEHEYYKSKAYTIPFMPLKRIYSTRMILVGDAAGIVDPWTGGGINLGFKSAKYAALTAKKIIQEGSKTGNTIDISIYQNYMSNTLKILQLKGKILKIANWCQQHKLTNPRFEQLILKKLFPYV